MLQRKKKKLIQVIKLTILTILLTCCTTTRKIEAEVPNPIVNGESVVEYDETTDEVKMPFWYWKKIVEFIIEVKEKL